MQSEVRYFPSLSSFCCLLTAFVGRLRPFVTFKVTLISP
jgi:hypothetical protein